MKNTFGNSLSVTLFGESHGAEIGAVLDGLTPGLPVDTDFIAAQLRRRRPAGRIATARQEPDPFRIVSGVFAGKTTGTPICILIPNSETRSTDYAATRPIARPGHADYTAYMKYHGYEDYRGGGHFSGRITAALVAAGAVVLSALADKGIRIGTHVARCAGIDDVPFENYEAEIARLGEMDGIAVLSPECGEIMREKIEDAAKNGDSVGGILETAVIGMPAGVGEPWFDTVEGVLSHALFSIPAVKGVQFGDAFHLVDEPGSIYNDPFRVEDGRIVTATNHNGGVNGGITNGMPILFRCAVKPTPSIYLPQDSVDFLKSENTKLQISGRHDPAILHRARIVVDSVSAIALCDLLLERFGTDYLL